MFSIKQIEITNFRSIDHLVIDCSQSINLFIGNNGAGKSTILDAIRIMLSWYVARLRNPSGKGILPNDQDINNGKSYCLLVVTLTNGVRWQIYRQRSSSRAQSAGKSDLSELNKHINSLFMDDRPGPLPIVAYYGVNRAVREMPLRLAKHHRLEALDAFDGNLDDGANYRSFFEWFREREDIENEEFSHTVFPLTFPLKSYEHDNQLQAVRNAIESILPEYGSFRVQRSPRAFILQKNGKRLDFRQLSDGEKCYITLVGDIARKLAMTHPASSSPLLEDGIVLLDEIDLHLHPTWQTLVVPRLRKCFPSCQFFITSHSPYVVSNIKPTDLMMVLGGDNPWRVEGQVYGAPTGELLNEYFRMPTLRNPEVQQHIDMVWQLLAKGDTTSDAFIDGVSWLQANLPAGDNELALIAFQAKLIEKGKSNDSH